MNKLNKIDLFLTAVLIIMSVTVEAEIRSEVVNYQVAGQSFQGYLSYDDAIKTKRPGILVVHEWWGHNAYVRRRAEELAKLGYTAFSLDMYGTGKLAKHPDEAKKFMLETLANMTEAEARFDAALRLLKQQSSVDGNKVAAIGYCFGGGTVLHMARKGRNLQGVVSFHGSLTTKVPAQKGQVKAKLLVLNGADDPFVSTDQISALVEEMKNAGADLEFVNYPGVKHSFTNPDADKYGKDFNLPLAYNAKADKDSWQHMQVFFKQIFNQN